MSEHVTSQNPNLGGGLSPSHEGSFEAALATVINRFLSKGNPQFRARLLNQMVQLARHGNFAETFIRTTPEGTDMVNFARLWEYVLVQADRQTRGYVAKSSRGDFEQTRKDFEDCVDFMVSKLKAASVRHKMDLSGTNFISRVAQRYGIAQKVRKGPGPVAGGGLAQPVADVVHEDKPEDAPKPKKTSKVKVDLPEVDTM